MSTISERWKNLLNKKGIKAAELAQILEINDSTISRILNGTQIPNSVTLHKAAKYFNVSMEYLLTGENFCENANFDLNIDDMTFLNLFNQLNESDKEEIIGIINLKLMKYKKHHSQEKLNSSFSTSQTDNAKMA